MKYPNGIQGIKINRLTPISQVPQSKKWLCICECGNEKEILQEHIISGHTKSCGCLSKEVTGKLNFKHGQVGKNNPTAEYNAWASIRQRCYNPKVEEFKNYGARGIKMCDRWKDSFVNFLEDMGKKPTKKHSLERRSNDGDYEPNNCKWATSYEQNRNKRNSVYLEFEGQKMIQQDWAAKLGISGQTIIYNLKKGRSLKDIINKLSKKELKLHK